MIYQYSQYPRKNKETNKWEITQTTDDGSDSKTLEYDSQSEAHSFLKSIKNKSIKSKSDLINEATSLESFLSTQLNEQLPIADVGFADDLAEIEKQKQEFTDDFEHKEKESLDRAKNLLSSVVVFYFGAGKMDNDVYIKTKIEIESLSLSSLIFQLEIARSALRKLLQEITMGNTSPRMFEVLTGLQRVSLDISKYLQDYTATFQSSIKNLKNDILSGQTGDPLLNVNQQNTKEDENYKTADRKSLISKISKIVEETRAPIQILSKNSNLNVENAEYETIIDENSSSDAVDETYGLSTFGD